MSEPKPSYLRLFGNFLGTENGFWLTMGLTALCCIVAFWLLEIATFALSVIAIILPAMIIIHDSHQSRIAQARDEALHKKLDALIVGVDKAPNELAGIEIEAEQKIEQER